MMYCTRGRSTFILLSKAVSLHLLQHFLLLQSILEARILTDADVDVQELVTTAYFSIQSIEILALKRSLLTSGESCRPVTAE